jgi:heme-degrading monooxygenase HmoA
MYQPISSILVFLLAIVPTTQAFTSQSQAPRSWNVGRRSFASSPVAVSTADAVDTDENNSLAADMGLLKRDRYIATNRFAVRKDQQAKFEQRWVNRKSKLATLEGFRYFHLMRRVDLQDDGTTVYNGGDTSEEAQNNYVSFTIWQKKSHFSAWRGGEAFKEAHGGTSIGAFLTTMVSSAFVLRGAPKPAFYDALLLQGKKPDILPPTVDGWRSVESDGESVLPVECFVGMENFFVPPEHAVAFEQFWASMKSSMAEFDGFVAFSLMRRDGQTKGHGTVEMTDAEPTYVATLIFKNRKLFENWKANHAPAPKPEEGAKAPPKMWTRAPEKVYYEGTLVITKEDGA